MSGGRAGTPADGGYLRIADEIARDIERGRIAVGAALPTHRDMAATRRVAVATITRAYKELRRRGLTDAAPGRGTFVRRPRAPTSRHADGEIVLDLTMSWLEPRAHAAELLQRLAALSAEGRVELLGYTPAEGLLSHRQAAATWIRTMGLDARPEQVLLTVGALHAMAIAFAVLVKPGGTVLCEEMTYPGVRQQADLLHFRLRGVSMDAEGLVPRALAAAARDTGARVLYCMPTLQNPTSAVMSEKRRRAIAEVAREHDLTIVEDDAYGPLLPGAPPLAAFAPERTIYVASMSKAMAAAFRMGIIVAPPALVAPLTAAIRSTVLGASALLVEAATTALIDGTVGRVIAWKRRELAERQELVRRTFDARLLRTHPASQNVWLTLPAPWSAEQFVAAARLEGVLVSPSTPFCVVPAKRDAVRISLGPPTTRAVLQQALGTLDRLLRDGPANARSVV